MHKKIKIHDPFLSKDEKQAAEKVFKSHFWALAKGNKKVSEFEKKFKEYIKSDECVAVDSGSAALLLSMHLMNIKNKEVILPSLCHVSAAHSVVLNGGKPIFVDINPKTLCLEPDSIRNAISKKTKVILPVHFGGLPCDIQEIKQICHDSNIYLLEDAALAAGSSYKNKKIGSHGDAVCFSFHPVKIISAPKGGAITLNGKVAKRFKQNLLAARNSGISYKTNYTVNQLGWNFYMNEFSAAIGIAQLKKLDKMILKRNEIAKRYFNEIELERKMPYEKECAYNFYWILVKNQKKFINQMRQHKIEVANYHPPIHKLEYYNSNKKLKNTEGITTHLILLPTHPNLSDLDVDKIIKLTNKFS